MYQLTDVSKRYKQGKRTVDALKSVTLTIDEGELIAIQGPTGGGKSTLLQLLGGLDRATSGRVEFDGQDLTSLGEGRLTKVRAQALGFVFQGFNLIPTLSAQENVETALVPLGVGGKARKERAAAALESVGLGDRGTHIPAELSGGQQQRVAIARALVKEPRVLLADEPTGNLDEETRDEIVELMESLWRDRGLTVVMVTHDSRVARRARRQLLIKKGTLTVKKDDRRPANWKRPVASESTTEVLDSAGDSPELGDTTSESE